MMAKRKYRSEKEIERDIMDFVESLRFPTTSTEIARVVGLNGVTAKKYLDKLKGEGKLYLKKVGRQNQWWTDDVYEQKKLARKSVKLEKENVELKEKTKQQGNEILELKKENKELKKQIKKFQDSPN